jgi:hypothetical protein
VCDRNGVGNDCDAGTSGGGRGEKKECELDVKRGRTKGIERTNIHIHTSARRSRDISGRKRGRERLLLVLYYNLQLRIVQ